LIPGRAVWHTFTGRRRFGSVGPHFAQKGDIGLTTDRRTEPTTTRRVRARDRTRTTAPGRRAPRLAVADRRRQLLECAIRVFAREGLNSAGHADVAKEAGVAVPTVFAYFPSKKALLSAVVQEVDRYIMERAATMAAAQPTASDKMIAILHDFAESFDTRLDYLKIWLNWATSFQEDVWPLFVDFMDRVADIHREIIAEAQQAGELTDNVDPEMSAYLLLGAATVIIQMKVAKRDPNSIARYLETTIHGALHQR
jgi:AcrR family transcriptional regulator